MKYFWTSRFVSGLPLLVLFTLSMGGFVHAQSTPTDNAIINEFQFNGYTRYWHDTYHEWYRYGNLFKMALPRVEETILQSKVDVAEDMGIPGLLMQEGFMNDLLSGPYEILDQPVPNQLEGALSKGNVLVFVDPGSEVGKMLVSNLPGDWQWPRKLKSHQYDDPGLVRADLFQVIPGNEPAPNDSAQSSKVEHLPFSRTQAQRKVLE